MLRKYFLLIKKLFYPSRNSCRIVDFDHNTQKITLQFKLKSSTMKLSLVDAISNASLVDTLSPTEASWLGGHYGRQLQAKVEGRATSLNNREMDMQLRRSNAQYRIISLNRDQKISYVDTLSNEVFVEHPSAIVNNEYVLSKFDVSQACYIGLLAGIYLEKTISNDAMIDRNIQDAAQVMPTSKLRLVR